MAAVSKSKKNPKPVEICAEASLPGYFQSELRIFFTADIVGSTSYKQSAFSKSRSNDTTSRKTKPQDEAKLRRSQLHPPWFAPISEFYQVAQQSVQSYWGKRLVNWKDVVDLGTPPSYWKAIGDEIAFSKILTDRRQIIACLDVWTQALKDMRASLKRHSESLDVKSAAWIAGFPITNTEVVLGSFRDPNDRAYEDDDDFVFHSLESLERLKSTKDAHQNQALILDFIGPSIDTGFRLAAYSSPRRLVLSVDLAYMYADVILQDRIDATRAQFDPDTMHIYYHGAVSLKGLLSGRPYPIFWIDIDHRNESELAILNKLEQKLTGTENLKNESVKLFCQEFIEKHPDYISIPYIAKSDGTMAYGASSPTHKLRFQGLLGVVKWFDDEKKKRPQQQEDIGNPTEFASSVEVPNIETLQIIGPVGI